jgi:phosphoglucosamine mutase
VILLDHATTGDGVLTGLLLAARVAETGTALNRLAAVMTQMPQVLINVRGVDRDRLETDDIVQAAVETESRALGDGGRILLRKSGTEPLVRVMVEAGSEAEATAVAHRLVTVVKDRLSL